MYGTVDASAVGKRIARRTSKEHEFVQGLCSPSRFVHVKRHVQLLVHGDGLMVEMPTHEEKWFASVLFLKYN